MRMVTRVQERVQLLCLFSGSVIAKCLQAVPKTAMTDDSFVRGVKLFVTFMKKKLSLRPTRTVASCGALHPERSRKVQAQVYSQRCNGPAQRQRQRQSLQLEEHKAFD